jgi:hypothetical protein
MNYRKIVGVLFFFLAVYQLQAQSVRHKIAVFAPLYLDSAFDETNTYRYGKQFPKYISPGLEFYEGVQLALDSMKKEGAKMDVFVYDTRAAKKSIAQQLDADELQGLEMIIAYATPQESWSIASAARNKKIPYINVNLPNDAGITNNPYFVMLNTSLKTHVEQIYKYAQKYYALNTVVVYRKKGQVEDMIRGFLDEQAKSTAGVPLKLKYVDLSDNFTTGDLLGSLDSNKTNFCVSGSLDEAFGKKLALSLSSVSKDYDVTLMGMPTFDNFSKDFSKPEYKGTTFIYSTPFYNARLDKVSLSISDYFNKKMYARPSDMVMRGYETMWKFSKLLMKYPADFSSSVSRKEFNVFREMDIQPVINKQTNTFDYFENKKLFFVKSKDGVKTVN